MKSNIFRKLQLFGEDGKRHVIHREPKKVLQAADPWLVVSIVALSIFGVLMVYDSSVAIALRDFGDQYYYVKEQVKWFIAGLAAFIVFSKIPYTIWRKYALHLLVVTLVLLMAVFIPGAGIRAYGAHRWINFGFFVMQPAEFAKLTMIFYLSAWFTHPEKSRFLSFLLLLGMVVGLVMLEPDLGTSSIILCIALLLYFYSGAPIRHFMFMVPMLIAAVLVLAIIAPYRMQRITTFINRQSDPLGASYHIRQVLLGLGSGGVTGVGIGKSRQKYEYLPEANTDSIFAIIGEETGFLGAMLVMSLYVSIIWRGYAIALAARDMFGKLLALGISSWVAVQTMINLSAMVALIPLTGVPLPFISYGGSSFIILLSAMGILLNISKHK
jgi:cell division protein FtsW